MPKGKESEYFNWPTTDARKTSSTTSMQEGGGILDRIRERQKARRKKGQEAVNKEVQKMKKERKARTVKADAQQAEKIARIKARKEGKPKPNVKPVNLKEKVGKEIALPEAHLTSPLKGKRTAGGKQLPYSPVKSKAGRAKRRLGDKLKSVAKQFKPQKVKKSPPRKKGPVFSAKKQAERTAKLQTVSKPSKSPKKVTKKNVTIYDRKKPVQDSPGGVGVAGAKKAETGRKWKSASASAKKAGTSMSALIAARKKHKKGSAEYKKIQNKINKHYGVKKRH
tara:strand:+ start:753 stop:1592 length:840 start_codon:yes stop_codon:yes gene_type:complete